MWGWDETYGWVTPDDFNEWGQTNLTPISDTEDMCDE